MSVNLGCQYRFMTKHLLDSPQIGPAIYKMGGERMAECMRAYPFVQSYLLGEIFNDSKYHYTTKLFTPAVKEQNIFALFADRE